MFTVTGQGRTEVLLAVRTQCVANLWLQGIELDVRLCHCSAEKLQASHWT